MYDKHILNIYIYIYPITFNISVLIYLDLQKKYNKNIGIVITDTFGRPWRLGQVNVAVGVSGIPVTKNEKGNQDSFGNYMKVTEPAFCDEIAAASGLLIKKSGKTPIVLFRGIEWISTNSSIKDILRTKKEDMFL